VIISSAIRHNSKVCEHLKSTEFKGYENVKRYMDWIEGLNDITWDQIHNKDEIKSSSKKAKDTKMKLTGSHELINFVRKKDLDKARAILKANPLAITS